MIFFWRLIPKAVWSKNSISIRRFLKNEPQKSNLEKCFYSTASGTRAKATTSLLLNGTFLHSNIFYSNISCMSLLVKYKRCKIYTRVHFYDRALQSLSVPGACVACVYVHVWVCMCDCMCVCLCVCVHLYAVRSHCAAQETFSHSKAVRYVIKTLTNHSLIL